MPPGDPIVFLPPLVPAVETFAPYHWCQVRSVFAREIVRAQGSGNDPVGWARAYLEADSVVDALRRGMGEQAALGDNARPGEANWRDVSCFAFIYAVEAPDMRARIRQAMSEGKMGPRLGVPVGTQGQMCPREVAYEAANYPEPACYPIEARRPVALAIAGVVVGGFVTWVLIKASEQWAQRK